MVIVALWERGDQVAASPGLSADRRGCPGAGCRSSCVSCDVIVRRGQIARMLVFLPCGGASAQAKTVCCGDARTRNPFGIRGDMDAPLTCDGDV